MIVGSLIKTRRRPCSYRAILQERKSAQTVHLHRLRSRPLERSRRKPWFKTSSCIRIFLITTVVVVAGALKGAILQLMYTKDWDGVVPNGSESITILSGDHLRFCPGCDLFCKGIQARSVDSFVTPEPWDMPAGYDSQVIMAAGCICPGSSIELSTLMVLLSLCRFTSGRTYLYHAKSNSQVLQQLLDDGVLKT